MLFQNYPVVTRRLCLAVLCSIGGGCATYSESFRPLEKEIIAQRPEKALKILEKSPPSGNDRLLYFLDKAMFLRMMGKHSESNQVLQSAKKYIEKFSPTSITEETASFFVNDSTKAFIGAPFEQVLVNFYSALNYLDMGEIDSARVEAQQVDIRLKTLASNEKNPILIANPYARYLTGIIYEDLGEWSNALIAYRKAYQAYKAHQKRYAVRVPRYLKYDLIRLTDYEGLRDERDKYIKEFKINKWDKQSSLKKNGEVVFVMNNGLAPIKRQRTVAHAAIKGQVARISLPYYQKRRNGFSNARISVGNQTATTVEVNDINSIAEKTLAHFLPGITARSIARAIAKHNVARAVGDRDSLAGLAMMVTNYATEVADTRSWLTLPGEIHMARMPLKAGKYTIDLQLRGAGNNVLHTYQFRDVKVKRGAKTYLTYHWVSPRALRSK
ncbi:MAG: hypothetical protein OEY52_07385 [Gammaproteobacteria bacterium]|nr:hypothetical protein [Gammaproteobacteria bacterium]